MVGDQTEQSPSRMLAELADWLLSQLTGAHSVSAFSDQADGLVYQLTGLPSWPDEWTGSFAGQRRKARYQGAAASVNLASGFSVAFWCPSLCRTDPSSCWWRRPGIPSRSANP